MNLKNFTKLLFLIIIIQGVYYISGVNDLMVKGFKLQELKRYSQNLTNENKNINIQITSLKSYNNLIKRVDELKMVSAGNIHYLKASKGDLAVR